MPSGRSHWSGSRSGFTLIEMLVVLAIVGLSFMTVTWVTRPLRDRALVRATIASFRTLSATARAEAIARGEAVALSIDIADRALRIPTLDRAQRLSRQVALTFVSASVSPGVPKEPHILFLPDGTSTGGRFSARVGEAVAAARISWVSGAAVDEP